MQSAPFPNSTDPYITTIKAHDCVPFARATGTHLHISLLPAWAARYRGVTCVRR